AKERPGRPGRDGTRGLLRPGRGWATGQPRPLPGISAGTLGQRMTRDVSPQPSSAPDAPGASPSPGRDRFRGTPAPGPGTHSPDYLLRCGQHDPHQQSTRRPGRQGRTGGAPVPRSAGKSSPGDRPGVGPAGGPRSEDPGPWHVSSLTRTTGVSSKPTT